jgi:hypothetical protein
VRVEAAMKTVWERIRWNLLWKQKNMSWKLNISTQSSRASSGTIYMTAHLRSKGHLLTPALKEMVWWGGVPSGGDTSSVLRERCENWCLRVSRGCAVRSCETS